ncbi:MAG: dihydrofolate reductase family protein [Gemmatimonadota bacterium]
MRLSVFIATSLDGFIARPDGALDWLPTPDPNGPEDFGYKSFMEDIDTLIMGRATFDTVLRFGVWPYQGKRVVVLSSRPLSVPDTFTGIFDGMTGAPEDVVKSLADRGARHAYVDGGRTIQQFLAAGLIDRLIITRIPVLIGAGLPLFGPVPADIPLVHTRTTAYENGFVQSEYSLFRAG